MSIAIFVYHSGRKPWPPQLGAAIVFFIFALFLPSGFNQLRSGGDNTYIAGNCIETYINLKTGVTGLMKGPSRRLGGATGSMKGPGRRPKIWGSRWAHAAAKDRQLIFTSSILLTTNITFNTDNHSQFSNNMGVALSFHDTPNSSSFFSAILL